MPLAVAVANILEYVGLEDRCVASCVSKVWAEGAEAPTLWEAWTFHFDNFVERGDRAWREEGEPLLYQRGCVFPLSDLRRLSPTLILRLQKHATCVAIHIHKHGLIVGPLLNPEVYDAWDFFSHLSFPRLLRAQLDFRTLYEPKEYRKSSDERKYVEFDFGDMDDVERWTNFDFDKTFAPLFGANTLLVDYVPDEDSVVSNCHRDIVVGPRNLSLEKLLRRFKFLEDFSMYSIENTIFGPYDSSEYSRSIYPGPPRPGIFSTLSQRIDSDLLQLRSFGWIDAHNLIVQMQEPISMSRLVSLGVDDEVLESQILEKLFVGLEEFAPSLEFLALNATLNADLISYCYLEPSDRAVFELLPSSIKDLVIGFMPVHGSGLDPSLICEHLSDSTTVHVLSPLDSPRGETWQEPSESQMEECVNGAGAVGVRDGGETLTWSSWRCLFWCVDLPARTMRADRFFSRRGRLDDEAIAMRRRARKQR